MEKELKRVLQSIREKTGILVQAQSKGGSLYASTFLDYIPIEKDLNLSASGILQSEGKTHFVFKFGGEDFYGLILGDTPTEKCYAELIRGYVEMAENKPQKLSFDERLSLIVTGNSSKSKISEFMADYSIPKTPVYVTLVKIQKGNVNEIIEFLSNYYGSVSTVYISQVCCALVFYVDDSDLGDALTPVKQAEMLKRSAFEELGAMVLVYVGSIVDNFLEVSTSFYQARSAEKSSVIFGGKNGVYAYKDYLFNKILEDIPREKLSDYLNVLSYGRENEIYKDEELFLTGECFLRNNLNVSETAREMYIHRNTLMYRLEKIEKLTGLDVKKFDDALNFRILYALYKIRT